MKVKKAVIYAASLAVIVNGVHTIMFPPENRVKYWLYVAGIPVGVCAMFQHRNS